MKKIIIALMVLIMAFAMTACGGGNAAGGSGSGQMIDVCMEIDCPDNAGMPDVEEYWFQIPEGSTALDMLHEFGKVYGIDIVMSDTSDTAYVVSIGGVAETAGAGWVYEVDDTMTLDPADKYIVKNKDEITWEFMSWNDMD